MRFRLRYLNHDLELSEGEFAVGRNASCQLSLDDPLVSRRHALLLVGPDMVTVEDLGSRNGVVVNGEKIQGRVLLRAGDRIQIGSQEMILVAAGAGASPASARSPLRATLTNLPGSEGALPPTEGRPTSANHTVEPDPSMVRRVDAFKVLGAVAEKAFAMGKAHEAERLLAGPLGDVLEAARSGKAVTEGLMEMAARFSSRLATATGKGAWADYVVELYATQRALIPAAVIDELYNAFRRVTAIDLVLLRDYVGFLRDQMPNLGPAERFLVQRIEGLERLAGIR